ncbi:MAG: hypothetical protein ACLFQX_05755 [Candidatus Kapaibacterium sp.]
MALGCAAWFSILVIPQIDDNPDNDIYYMASFAFFNTLTFLYMAIGAAYPWRGIPFIIIPWVILWQMFKK